MSESFKAVYAVLRELGIPSEDIRADASLFTDLSIDSTELVELVTAIEQKSHIHLQEKDLKNVQTVAELAAFIENKVAEK